MASGSGVVPPCCSSVKGLVTPGGGFAPENHERPERRSSRVRNDQVVRGDRLRGPLLRASNGSMSLLRCPAPWGRESLAHAFRRLQSPRRARIARSDRGRRCPPCRAGRPAGTVGGRARPARGAWHAGRARGPRRPARRVDPPARQVPADRPRARRDRVQPDADRSLPAGRAGRQAAGQDGGRPRLRAARRRAGAMRPPGRAAPPGCRPTTRAPRSAIGTRPRWARSTCGRPASSGPSPASASREQGPDADDPALTLEVWRERIRRHPGELKNLLPQPVVRGRDRQRLQRRDPPRRAAAAVPQALDAWRPRRSTRCTRATRSTLADAIAVLRERVPPTFEKQVRDFLAVHDKGGQPCPRCGTGSPRCAPAASSPRTAGAASTDGARPRRSGDLRGPGPMWSSGIADAVQRADRLERRPELGGDPDQRVARLDLVGRVAGACGRAGAGGSTRCRAGVLGSADAVGRLGGRGRSRLALRGHALASRGEATAADGRRAAAGQTRARTIAAKAMARSTMRTAWPDARSEPERRAGRSAMPAVVEDDRGRAGDRTGQRRRAVVGDRPGRAGAAVEGRAAGGGRRSGTAGAASRRRAGPAARPPAAMVARGRRAPPGAVGRRRGTGRCRDRASGRRIGVDARRARCALASTAVMRCKDSRGPAEPGRRRVRRSGRRRSRERKNPGDDLFSRKAALSVSSALESLTSVFGMGTGVASPLESPGFFASGSFRQRLDATVRGPRGAPEWIFDIE